MLKRSKNLIFIIEETHKKCDVSSNLVWLYMNRCTINEDDQFEVLGVVQQTEKKLKPNVPINKNDDKKYLAAIIADGLNMASKLWTKSLEAGNHELHLIVGLSTGLEFIDSISNLLSRRHRLSQRIIKNLIQSYGAEVTNFLGKGGINSERNIVKNFSSVTVLNDCRIRVITREKMLARTHELLNREKMLRGTHFTLRKAIYPDVDGFYVNLLRSNFQRLVNVPIYCHMRNFKRFKMLSETPSNFGNEDFADVNTMRKLGQISDSETYYCQYLGKRFSFTISKLYFHQ